MVYSRNCAVAARIWLSAAGEYNFEMIPPSHDLLISVALPVGEAKVIVYAGNSGEAPRPQEHMSPVSEDPQDS